MSVIIDTEVFSRVAEIMNHFSKSVYDVQRHIDAYLDSVKQEFIRQLEIIDTLLKKAITDEEKAKEAVVVAEKEWQLAIKATEEAEYNRNTASEEKEKAESLKDAAKNEKDAAEIAMKNAYNAKQEAYQDRKSHLISYDRFQDYLNDFNEKREIYNQRKAEYNCKKANFIDKLNILKAKEIILRNSKIRQEETKRAYYTAKDRHKKALEEYQLRKSNLKEAKKIQTTFEMYYADYYRNYCIGESLSCNTLLTMLRSNMKKEFEENMKKIEAAAFDILRCSLKENVSVETLYIQDSHSSQKSEETRNRLKDQFRETMKELNQDLKRPEDEHPDYIERCKYCHLPLYLCECDHSKDPESNS